MGEQDRTRSVVGMAERLYLERRSGIFTIWLAGPLNEPKERVAMLCGCGGEVTESFMTEGVENLARPAGRSCSSGRSPIRLDGSEGGSIVTWIQRYLRTVGKSPLSSRPRAGMTGSP